MGAEDFTTAKALVVDAFAKAEALVRHMGVHSIDPMLSLYVNDYKEAKADALEALSRV